MTCDDVIFQNGAKDGPAQDRSSQGYGQKTDQGERMREEGRRERMQFVTISFQPWPK